MIDIDFIDAQLITLHILIIEVTQSQREQQNNDNKNEDNNFEQLVKNDNINDLNKIRHNDRQRNSSLMNFFDSMYDNKLITIDDIIEHVNKETYYQNVHVFINRIKDIIHVDELKIFCQNL